MVFGDRSNNLKNVFDVRSVMNRPQKPRAFPDSQAESDVELCALIIEQAIDDWNALERGEYSRRIIDTQFVYRAEVEGFFKGAWFETLLSYALPSHSPAEVRKILGIGEPNGRIER